LRPPTGAIDQKEYFDRLRRGEPTELRQSAIKPLLKLLFQLAIDFDRLRHRFELFLAIPWRTVRHVLSLPLVLQEVFDYRDALVDRSHASIERREGFAGCGSGFPGSSASSARATGTKRRRKA
jgi:hypothetical protein